MNKNVTLIVIFLLFAIISTNPGLALTGKDVIELKKAGLSDQTIQLIVKEKVIETAAFSIDDFVNMKRAGVNENTLQILIKDGALPANRKPIIYGQTTRSIRQISPQDIIELKKNGISDSVIQSVIEATKSSDEKDRERAWRMLENLHLRIYEPGGR